MGLLQPQRRAFIAVGLFCLFHAPESAPCRQHRFFMRHAPPFEVVGEEGEVRVDFAGEVFLGPLVAEETTELRDRSFQMPEHRGFPTLS
jgi:hypothetical protein